MIQIVSMAALVATAAAIPYAGRPAWLVVAALLAIWIVSSKLGAPDRRGALAQVLAAGFVLAYYAFVWVSRTPNALALLEDLPETGTVHPDVYYNLLTKGFLQGRLDLAYEPTAELLACSDPYDPLTRKGYWLWDASFYHGRFYLYFGVTPVLTLLLPFRLLTGLYLPVVTAGAVMAMAGVVGQLLWFNELGKRYGLQALHPLVQALCVAGLGLSNSVAYVLRRPSLWELPILTAFCCLMWGLFLLTRSLRTGRHRDRMLASLLLGLSAGARPHFGLTVLLLVAVFLIHRSTWQRQSIRETLGRGLALFAPFGAVISLLALYNYLRFDDWASFGAKYQLNHVDFRTFAPSWPNVKAALAGYALAKPALGPEFPYLRSTLNLPWGLTHSGTPERTVGLLYCAPFAAALALLPMLWRRRVLIVIPIVLVAFACGIALICASVTVTQRYAVDFVPVILVAAVAVFVGVLRAARSPLFQGLLAGVWSSAILVGCVAGILLAMVGQYDEFAGQQPTLWALLRMLL